MAEAIITLADCANKHWNPAKGGTQITSHGPMEFMKEVNFQLRAGATLVDGYAPFCKHLFLRNWTDALQGVGSIAGNEHALRSDYEARADDEMEVLVRWLDKALVEQPRAAWLDIVLYSTEQMREENAAVANPEADWAVVTILGTPTPEETPMPPITAWRNALGIEEGGSGVPVNREAYDKSVRYWKVWAIIK